MNYLIHKDYIICIIGKSGSGKSTIASYYKEQGYNVIESYTDRPKRFENEWGHIFIEPDEIKGFKNEMIAFTVYNGYSYFALKSQYKNKGISFYIIEPSGVKNLKEKIKDAELIFIYINTDEAIRRKRMLQRNMADVIDEAKHNEIIDSIENRISTDREVFKTLECDIVIDNNSDIKRTLEIIDKLLMTF